MAHPRDRELSRDDADALVQRCRKQDPEALERVFRQHAETVERVITRTLGPRPEVEDILQITFMRAADAFPRFRGEASVRTWLCRIAVRATIDHLRQPRQKRPHLALIAESPQDLIEASQEVQLDQRRRLERVYYHLDQIEAPKRVAFVLHVLEGHSIEQVAALMGATKSATKSRIFWARKNLLSRARRDPQLRPFLEGA